MESQKLLKLIQKYDRSGPRYTSYPTLPQWKTVFEQEDLQNKTSSLKNIPISLYTHIPFCESKCYYCACNVIVTQKKEKADTYLNYIKKELDLISPNISHLPVSQIHWGGGTPTYLNCEQIVLLFKEYEKRFSILKEAEISLEIDPRVTTLEQLKVLRSLGFNRISLGVQDFDSHVQKAIHRNQTEEKTKYIYEKCRELGFRSLNMDFVYGLPFQTQKSFEKNLKTIIGFKPDRIAFYNYAHVPWQAPYQKFISETVLPSVEMRVKFLTTALQLFKEAGYLAIGLDHFARPEDDLVRAFEIHSLQRSFMGYTTQKAQYLFAFGVSAVSDLRDVYWQNFRKLSHYYKALDQGKWPMMQGHRLNEDDKLRRDIIMGFMCYLKVTIEPNAFSKELARLKEFEDDGILNINSNEITVTELGRIFLRNICMEFDAYFQSTNLPGTFVPKRYSKTL